MLQAAIAFFVLGLVAILLGANGIGGLSVDIGKTLLFVFLILAVISFVASLVQTILSTGSPEEPFSIVRRGDGATAMRRTAAWGSLSELLP